MSSEPLAGGEPPPRAGVSLGRATRLLGLILLILLCLGFLVPDRAGRPTLVGFVVDLRDERGMELVEARWPAIVSSAEAAHQDPFLLAAIMWCESRGVSGRVSSAGALGLMQLMLGSAKDAARRLDLEEPTREAVLEDDDLNLRLAAEHLAWLERSSPEWEVEAILVAYNTGRGRLQGWIEEAGSFTAWTEKQAARLALGQDPSIAFTYARRVLAMREEFLRRRAAKSDSGEPNHSAPGP